ncbi:hypothetical protein PMIN03_005534 [Paraphaeosphaeria minitans]
MAGAFRVFAKLGFADGGSGHISLRDPIQPNTFWINPYGVHFALFTVSDMVHVDGHGTRIGGAEKLINTAGFIIPQTRPPRRMPHAHCMFYGDLEVYTNFGGVVFAKEEGGRLAEALGSTKKNMIVQNHGLLTCGGMVGEAAAFFIALERACQCQLLTEAAIGGDVGKVSGLHKNIVSEEEAAYTKKGTGTAEVMYMQFEPEYQLILKETKGDFFV